MHRAATQRNEGQEDEEREEAFFKRYLEFCRAKVSPRLSQPAADSLVSQYVELREQVRCSIPCLLSIITAKPCSPHLSGACATYACAVEPCDEWTTPVRCPGWRNTPLLRYFANLQFHKRTLLV